VDGVDMEIPRGEVLGVVGESGCGKSITALSVLRLIPRPGQIVDGEILYYPSRGEPVNLTAFKQDSREIIRIRGNEIAMVFQEPMTSLTPVYTIGHQIIEAIMLHQDVDRNEAHKRAVDMISRVGIPDPRQRVDEYPFQLSGGMRQRALIAMALSCNPTCLIADEPTTALDVTIQAQILRLMRELQARMNMSIMMITHDLGVIAEMADSVVVMYLGKIVERGSSRQIFHNPLHPYTKGLLNTVPRIDVRKRLESIRGTVPTPFNLPPGCSFAPRCPSAMDKCHEEPPEFTVEEGHTAKCWLWEGE
jgi:oligopeptide/dipeptide ABC transporter ATP-binding protein